MRFSIALTRHFLCSFLCISSPALADNQGNLRQKLFEMDKVAALAHFDTSQQQACLNAFHSRYQSQYTLNSALTFDERLSLVVYDQLFWKGESSVQRGLIFAGSVTDQSGSKAGNLMCYYAITDYQLDFQSAYVLPYPTKASTKESARESIMAPTAGGTLQASLITLSDKE